MKKGIILLLVMTIIMSFILMNSSIAVQAKTLEIGIGTPLTGPIGNVGSNYKNAVLMAIERQNAKGGVTIAGEKYTLEAVIRDTKFDPAVSKTVAEEFVYSKKLKVIFGPSQNEAFSMQPITEPAKVLLFAMSPVPGQCEPDKPYSFFLGGINEEMYVPSLTYIKEFYPEAKTVYSMGPDLPDGPFWQAAAETMCKYYGFEWLGIERYPYNITDFTPVVSRLMAKKPDVVDISQSGGAMGGLMGLFIKQLRQQGYKGLIMMPTSPPPDILKTVPKAYMNKVISNDVNLESDLIPEEYRSLYIGYEERFKGLAIDLLGQAYNGAKAFFEFLDGQDTMDTEVWMKKFAEYNWDDVFGLKSSWIGKPMFGINRGLITNVWASEYFDGVMETKFVAPIPWELFK